MSYLDTAAIIWPPVVNAGDHVALAAGVASVAQNTGFAASPLEPGAYYTFVCEADCTILFGNTGVLAPTATSWPLFAKIPQGYYITAATRLFRALSAAGGELKWYRSSPPP